MNSPYAIDLPTLDLVIQYSPWTVTPDTLVIDVIGLMNRVRGGDSSLFNAISPQHDSCALIVEGTRLVGIFTLQDVVHLTALGRNLSEVRIAEVMTQPVINLTLTESENALAALLFMRQHQIRHLPVVDTKGELIGLITQDRIRQVVEPAHLLKFRTVAEVMVTTLVHAPPTASVLELAQLMSDRRISCIVIVAGEQEKKKSSPLLPVGIITERDIVNFQLQRLDIAQTPAEAVMSQPVCSVSSTASLWTVKQLMQEQGVRRVIVVGEQGELQGLVTQTNLLQIFDPAEILGVMEALQKTVEEQTVQLREANEQLQQHVRQRQQVEASLQQTEAELELRVAERTAELVQANTRLRGEIAEREKVEVACQESEQRLQLALSASSTGIWDWNLKTNEVIWSESMFPLFDVNPDKFEGKFESSFLNFVHPEDREFVAQSMARAIDEQAICDIEFRVVWADGRVHWANGKGKVFYDKNSQPVRMIGAHQDITARKQAEHIIREQAALIDIATDAIFVRDLEKRILFWSRGAENLYGWTAEESLGKKADELFCRGLSSQLAIGMQETIEEGSWQSELEQITKTGKKIIVASRWTLVRDESGKPQSILVVNTDITEKKQLEQQFYRAQRLESVGTLASGIAHDLNNVFAPIMMIAQLLPSRCKNVDARTQELFQTLENSSQRGANLVKQILTFARGTEGKPILLQPGHLLKELVKVIKQTFPKSIEIQTHIPTNTLWMVKADPTQLEQVFMNLAVNARDAMPNGGILTIFAENRFLDQTYARMNLDAHLGDYIVVTVSDTGTGIPPELLEHIFEPFFTTKELGTGTGLGLATVLGIVKNHAGFVEVSSQVGKGTQFQVYLPIGEGTLAESRIEGELPRGNGELILIVDDELVIQETTKETLENYNYKTLVANDGIEAIALYAQYQQEISAVLLDMLMPNMDGLTTIRTLKTLDPEVKIIATSGLPANCQKALFVGATAFLSKPYTARDLLTTFSHK
ncbi:CBS domain-containing protein [Anabaena sp. UHCC 0399]|uniref:CBS domain-containing protein n=1 Tax=Anabaena sp. UHCC 0399 TaxID=3110238 RepID=UPI002B1EC2E7|nr:CBS domain-containing protein [Anabaena sp. UHCC 0399]MEA5568644.1 CBS domain-containing protein [Anabaena sp. UHCC 0399]